MTVILTPCVSSS